MEKEESSYDYTNLWEVFDLNLVGITLLLPIDGEGDGLRQRIWDWGQRISEVFDLNLVGITLLLPIDGEGDGLRQRIWDWGQRISE
ncbi:hypothetical protein LINPERHAP1_LOCUS19650, partial [Linum perenne]